ncbi:MAG: peptidoglycan-binding protein [Candidatus Omnitrophica bacterium]|nr:peptidoglycan-binding protein [Candidatus Omnitrophota bacterium]
MKRAENKFGPLNLFSFSLMLLALGGCAGTKAPTTVNNLEIKVAHLERSLEEQTQTIDSLKYQVEDLTRQNGSNSEASRPVEEPVIKDKESSKSKSSEGDQKDVLHVDADPKDVQRALKAAGYYDGAIDGKLGKSTRKAIKSFQKDYGLTADGVIGKKTWIEMKTFLKKKSEKAE